MVHPELEQVIRHALVIEAKERWPTIDKFKDELIRLLNGVRLRAAALTDQQLQYAATDVLHLHALRAKLDAILAREGRADLARAAFDFLPARTLLDLEGWAEQDIFAH